MSRFFILLAVALALPAYAQSDWQQRQLEGARKEGSLLL